MLSVYLKYNQCDTISLVLKFDQAEVFSNLGLSWAVTTDQSKSVIARAMTPLGFTRVS